jgi:signal transduction histidine kinase/ligand-binding sensor domain-containing protein
VRSLIVGLGVVLALCVRLQADADVPAFRFDFWTTANGLPSNTISALRHTRDGYLWLATDHGLARFDGMRFTTFSKSETAGIVGSRFLTLWESNAGDLWAGTIDGGVSRYRDGRFTTFTTKDGLTRDLVRRVDEDASGAIWTYHDIGVSTWRDGRWRADALPAPPIPGCQTAPSFTSVVGDRLGYWCWNDTGWARFAYGRWSALPLPPGITNPRALKVGWMVEDAQRRIWFNLLDRPGESYSVSNDRLTVFRGLAPDHRVFYQDQRGTRWTNNSAGQAFLWKDGVSTVLPELHLKFSPVAIEDREGTLWIGTYSHGLVRGRLQVLEMHRHPGGAEANFVYPILQDRTGDVWVSSGFQGLTRLRQGRFEALTIDGRPQTSEISSLFEDTDGTIWVGLFRKGVARVVDGRLRTERDLSAQINGRVDVIHRDRTGTLWLGGNAGLHQWRDGRLTRFTSKEGLAFDHVKAMHEDASGALWIGGYGGVSRWKDGAFHSLTRADGLSSDRVITLQSDERGVIWIGTHDGGLNRLERGRLTRYTLKDGLYDDIVTQILADSRGFLWIGGPRGISRVSRAELDAFAEGRTASISSTPFGPIDPRRPFECNGGFQPSGFRAHDGTLWLATSDGVAVIDPAIVPLNPTRPPLVIESCLLDRESVDCRGGLRIEPHREVVEIAYTGLSFVSPEQMRFRYKLQGLDRDWVEAGDRRTAYYSHLPPGHYTFTVIGANSDGLWNQTGASLAITVIPPFWWTWWFTGLVGLSVFGLAAGGVWGVWTYRVAQLRRASELREAFTRQLITSQEAERARIAGELHDSLGQHLVIIRNWSHLGAQHLDPQAPAREELDLITATASQAIAEVREIAYNLGPYHLERLGLAGTLGDMIRRVAGASSISVTTDLDGYDGALSRDAEMNLYRIAQEALNNVMKHAQATTLQVALKQEGATVRLTIADNGVGFVPDAAAGTRHNAGTGFGLTSIGERVRLLHGALSVRSTPGRGTTVEVVLESAQPDLRPHSRRPPYEQDQQQRPIA